MELIPLYSDKKKVSIMIFSISKNNKLILEQILTIRMLYFMSVIKSLKRLCKML